MRVSPSMFPAKVIVAPNSPKLRANARTSPVRIPGIANGNVIVKSARNGLAPRVVAACHLRFRPRTLVPRVYAGQIECPASIAGWAPKLGPAGS